MYNLLQKNCAQHTPAPFSSVCIYNNYDNNNNIINKLQKNTLYFELNLVVIMYKHYSTI